MHDSLHPVCRCPQPEQSTTSLRGELEETQNTPFDTTSAFASYSTRTDALSVSHRHFKEVMKDWALRARCARALGAFPADGASSISYNHLGVCLSAATFDRNATSLVDAARALLSSGMPSDCAAADAVIKQLARAPSRAEEIGDGTVGSPACPDRRSNEPPRGRAGGQFLQNKAGRDRRTSGRPRRR